MTLRFFVVMMLVPQAVFAASADEIKIAQPRALMVLSEQLALRYGYLVTYEDAPADSTREIAVTHLANGREDKGPIWQPVTFHVEARQPNGPHASLAPAGTQLGSKPAPAQAFVPLGPAVMDPLIGEYNASGNPGQFKVIYDGEYAHIVPAARSVNGTMTEFQPILDTTVLVSQLSGSCWDLLQNLATELQQIRGYQIVLAFTPVYQMNSAQCSIHGHDLPARQVLTQLLDQMGQRGGVFPDQHYLWTLVHDSNTNAYFFSTRPVAQPTAAPAKAQPEKQPAPLTSPGWISAPIKK
jgi:hypothetical protein